MKLARTYIRLAALAICAIFFFPVQTSASEGKTYDWRSAKIYYLEQPDLTQEGSNAFLFGSGKVLIHAKQNLLASCADYSGDTLLKKSSVQSGVHSLGVEYREICRIEFKPGTIALLSVDHGILILTNLYEPKHESIRVNFLQLTTSLSVGEQVCIGKNMEEIISRLKNEPGSRKVVKCEQKENYSIVQMEVSLQPPLYNEDLIKCLHHSPFAEDRHLYDKLVKMAICLSVARHH